MTESHLKLLEGWLQHKNAQDKWVQYWCVLKDYIIYIFTSKETTRDNHTGVLQIGSDTQVKIGDTDQRRGYRFDLFTAKKLNKFKTSKFIERELWKAYITGLTEGDISDNYDLLPDQIQKIRDDIHRVIAHSQRPPLPINPIRSYHDNTSVGTGFQSPTDSGDISFNSETKMDMGGPIIRHKFWPQWERTEVPSWFFASITRDFAENVLTTGRDYGNTLMRESITFRDTGSYVISKKMEHTSRGPPFNHFEVIRISDGFKINVENAHKSMRCLSEVMDYFVSMSGSAVTRPMVTNDLKKLGLDTPGYDTKIWKSKTNAESGEDDAAYPAEAYDAPLTPPRGSASKTWGPSNKHTRDARAEMHGVTVSSRPGQRSRFNPDAMQQRVDAAKAIIHFDSTLDNLSRSEQGPEREYVNDVEIRRRQSQPFLIPPEDEAPQIHPRWQNRAVSVPALMIDQETLDLQASVKSPGLVRPSQGPPRVLPKPPKETEDVQDSPMSGLQKQLNDVKLRNVPKEERRVTFQEPSSSTQAVNAVDRNETGGLNKDAFKKHLESLMMNAGGPKISPLKVPPAHVVPPPPSLSPSQRQIEEEYDDIIYEDPDKPGSY